MAATASRIRLTISEFSAPVLTTTNRSPPLRPTIGSVDPGIARLSRAQ